MERLNIAEDEMQEVQSICEAPNHERFEMERHPLVIELPLRPDEAVELSAT